jgi:hypothetical protein
MSWLTYGGRTASDFPLAISSGGHISADLLKRYNPYEEAIKAIEPAIKEYLAQKKADDIANQYLNMQNPPRAEAVDPSLQGAPATAPQAGGVDAYKAHQLYQALLEKQQAAESQSTNDYWKNKVLEAQANKYQADADAPDPRFVTPNAPIVDPKTGFIWNGREWVKPASSSNTWAKNMVIARGKLDEKGEFTNTYDPPKGATNNGANEGPMVQVMTPSGEKIVVPWESYQAQIGQFNPADMYRQRIQPHYTEAAPEQVIPSTDYSTPSKTESKTRIIEKNGHHYEVDDVNKKVIRQID